MLTERNQDSIFFFFFFSDKLTSEENSCIIQLGAVDFSLICYTGSYP